MYLSNNFKRDIEINRQFINVESEFQIGKLNSSVGTAGLRCLQCITPTLSLLSLEGFAITTHQYDGGAWIINLKFLLKEMLLLLS